MLGLDTNVLIRFLVADDPAAYQVANDLIVSTVASGQKLMICIPMLLECEWVLRSVYKMDKASITATFDALLTREDAYFSDEPIVETALHWWKNSVADFADCLIVAACIAKGCSTIATFDRKAGRLPGAVLLHA